MNSLLKRLEALEKEIAKHDKGLFTVYYKDGTSKKIDISKVLWTALDEGDMIDRFEEDKSGTNDGEIEGLANALIRGEYAI